MNIRYSSTADLDPTDDELSHAYSNDILDNLAKEVKLMTFKNGMIKGITVQKLIRRWKEKRL